MPKLIKISQEIIDDTWVTLPKDASIEEVTTDTLIPMQLFLANVTRCQALERIGVWIDSDEEVELLEPHLSNLNLIAVNFPKFVDGRGYSTARILRDRMAYDGELRAIGDVLQDQLFFMKRCGFDTFALRDDKSAEQAVESLNDFSQSYQSAVDEPKPLFRRRA